MSKTAVLFSGQGAQYVGMAKDFYDQFEDSREVFEQASKALGFSMEELCFEENEKINMTEYTQAAMVTASIAILKQVEKAGIKADMTAGLSLGIQRKVGQNTAVFLRPDFTFRAIDGFGHAGFLTAAIGLAF